MLHEVSIGDVYITPIMKISYNVKKEQMIDLFFLDRSFCLKTVTIDYSEKERPVARETGSKTFNDYEGKGSVFFEIKRNTQQSLLDYLDTIDSNSNNDCKEIDFETCKKMFSETIRHRQMHNEFERLLNSIDDEDANITVKQIKEKFLRHN